MRTLLGCWLACLFFTETVVLAASLDGVIFPDKVLVDNQPLVLNGISQRTVTLFKIKIFVAALYLKEKSSSFEEITLEPSPKQIRLVMQRDVEREKIQSSWSDTFREGCDTDCAVLMPNLDKLNALMEDVKKGTLMVYTFYKDRVSFQIEDNPRGSLPGVILSRFLLSTWIGKLAPSESFRLGLLGADES